MERGRGGPGRRWLRAGVIAGLLGLAALGGGHGIAAQTGPLPVTVLPRQPGLTVPEYVPGQVVVLFQPDKVPITDAGATSQVDRTLAAAGIERRYCHPAGRPQRLRAQPDRPAYRSGRGDEKPPRWRRCAPGLKCAPPTSTSSA